MYICIYVHVHVYMYMYVHMYIYVCIHTNCADELKPAVMIVETKKD